MTSYTETESENLAIFRESLHQFINQHDPSAVDQFFSEEYIQHNEMIARMARQKGITQKENTKQWFTYMFTAIPDLQVEFEHVLADGDKVYAFLRWSGKHSGGEFIGVPPTHQEIVIRTAEIMRLKDGKFVEHWDVTGQSRLFEALGFMKPAIF